MLLLLVISCATGHGLPMTRSGGGSLGEISHPDLLKCCYCLLLVVPLVTGCLVVARWESCGFVKMNFASTGSLSVH
jgi:hypothetical protein